jgi:hypothetical protein
MSVKTADEEVKERLRQMRRQNDIVSLKNFEIIDVRNPALEYKESVPFNFNLLKISTH